MSLYFPHYLQLDKMDCGPTCLRMIAKYYNKSYTLQSLRVRSFITHEGVSMLGIRDAAESIGFRTNGVKISLVQLREEAPFARSIEVAYNHLTRKRSPSLKNTNCTNNKKITTDYKRII